MEGVTQNRKNCRVFRPARQALGLTPDCVVVSGCAGPGHMQQFAAEVAPEPGIFILAILKRPESNWV
jgi:hypothetical protein